MIKKVLGIIVFIALLGAAGYFILPFFSAKKGAPPQQQGAAPPVPVMVPVQQDVVNYYEFTGETEAVASVDIVARVSGYLETVNFHDGSDVKKGDLLFTIEKERYQSIRDQAYAQLKSSEAELTRAQVDFKRFQEALQENAVSKQDLTTKKAELDKAEAAVTANQAILAEAELDLSYTEIRSPIDGRISRRLVDSGNLVGPASVSHLTTVVTLSPMYIYFTISEKMIMDSLKNLDNYMGQEYKFQFALGDEQGYPHEGILDFMDNVVDPKTGTITIRGEFENKDKGILPGMFVHVNVPGTVQKDAVLVVETAICTDLGGKYLLIVNEENIVTHCPVEIGQKVGPMRVIKSGLEMGQQYIVTGLQFVYPGMKVNPQLIKK